MSRAVFRIQFAVGLRHHLRLAALVDHADFRSTKAGA